MTYFNVKTLFHTFILVPLLHTSLLPPQAPKNTYLYVMFDHRIVTYLSIRSGTMLATASRTGTVIRTFRCPSGEHIHTFRRGSYPVHIHSLCFCPGTRFLAAASSSGTIHVFCMDNNTASNVNGIGGSSNVHSIGAISNHNNVHANGGGHNRGSADAYNNTTHTATNSNTAAALSGREGTTGTYIYINILINT